MTEPTPAYRPAIGHPALHHGGTLRAQLSIEIPAAELACTSHWAEEQQLLISLHSFADTFSPAITQRLEVFERAATGGLV